MELLGVEFGVTIRTEIADPEEVGRLVNSVVSAVREVDESAEVVGFAMQSMYGEPVEDDDDDDEGDAPPLPPNFPPGGQN